MTKQNLPMLYTLVASVLPRGMGDDSDLATDDSANLAGIGASALMVVGIVLGAVVSLLILAELMPTYSSAVGNISENFTTADWGDATANSISPIFGLVVAIGGLFAIVGLAFLAYRFSRR